MTEQQSHAQVRPGQALACALVALIAALAIVPAAASAGQGVWINVHNKTSAYVNLLATGGYNCWDAQQLGHPVDQSFVAPFSDRTYVSETESSGHCRNSDGHLNVQIQLKEPETDRWYVPLASPEAYRLYWQDGGGENFGINLYDGMRTWLPRQDGSGLVCVHGAIKDANHADLWVYADEHCNTPVPSTIQQSNSPKPPVVGQSPGGGKASASASARSAGPDKSAIVDLLSMVGIACPWYVFPGEAEKCQRLNVGNEENWVIDNLDAEIREFKVTAKAAAKDEKTPVGTTVAPLSPKAPPVEILVKKTLSTTESNATTTQRGWKVGAKIGFKQTVKAKIPFFGEGGAEFSQEISGEYNYNKTETATKSQTDTREVSIKTTANPGFITTLEVFTSKRNADYIYEADLSFGKDGVSQNVTTPATLALDQSPSARQPCLAYSVSDGQVRNSIVNVGESLFRAGYRPDDSSLSLSQRTFLGAISGFKSGTKPCPGFPSHYASSASFKGTGVGNYENLGYDEKGNPVQLMVACVYVKPYAEGSASSSTASARRAIAHSSATEGNPCKKVPPEGGVVSPEAPGLLLDHRAATASSSARGKGPQTSGTRGSDRILGPHAGGTVRTGAGAVDIVKAGKGDTRVYGGARENVIFGNAGDDLLVGEGRMNYLHAGPGGDRLVSRGGKAIMYGEGGDDVFEAHDMEGVIFGGGGDDKVIATGDLSGLSISSGPGDHVYVLKGAGTPSIVQQPGPGRSTVVTKRNLEVFPHVDVARAYGPWRVTLSGAEETAKLIASRSGSVLVSGAAPTRLRGREGADAIVFNAENSNVAAGGDGADRFVFTGRPETAQRPRAHERPANRSAPLISDFEPADGDRLVLRTSAFGRQVLNLRRAFAVVADRAPRPKRHRATLLLDTDNGVVSFDRDGSGPISDRMVVELPGRTGLDRRWFQIERG